MLKFYGYAKCSTCRKAKSQLVAMGHTLKEIDIATDPPTKPLLKAILRSGDYQPRDLFNTSGQVYRKLNLKDTVNSMGQDELIELLAGNGMLVKRPVVTDGRRYTVGGDPERLGGVWGGS